MELQISDLKPGTDEMVTFLHGVVESALEGAAHLVRFTDGDVMGAVLHIMVDAGSESVGPEQLREDIIKGLDAMLADRAKEREKMN